MATHSSTLAWKTPWTEEPGRLQSMGSQRVGHDGVNLLYFKYIWLYQYLIFMSLPVSELVELNDISIYSGCGLISQYHRI